MPATRATTVGPPLLSTDGTMAKAWATIVIPMKITPSRMAIVIIVLAAFFASGFLNAGHAVGDRLDAGQGDRPAGERPQEQEDAQLLGPQGHRVGLRWQGVGRAASTIRATPPTTISRARTTNR